MIDLHLHLLPGIDDGARSFDETRAMLAQLKQLGFQALVATPHLGEPLTHHYHERVAAALVETQVIAAEQGIEVIGGFELLLRPDVPARLEAGEPSTLGGGQTVLVDLPAQVWPAETEQTLFAIQTAGFRPIFAHPERYTTIQQDPAIGLRLAERGVILQVTAGSLSGAFGRTAKRTGEFLLRHGVVNVIATDAHGPDGRLAAVSKGLQRARAIVGAAETDRLLSAAPHALLTDRPLPPHLSDTGAPPTGWRRLFRSSQ